MYGDGGLTALDMTAPAGGMAGWLEELPWDENDSGEMLLCGILAEAAKETGGHWSHPLA